MTAAVCPYCRCPIEEVEGQQCVCAGCGTPHHADCYAENGGCTVFGCSAAPADEAKLSLSGADLASPQSAGVANAPAPANQAAGTEPAATMVAPPAPPPPLNGAGVAPPSIAPQQNAGTVLFRQIPAPMTAPLSPTYADFETDPNAKNRMTFIVLGVLLGMLGAHNFYAGYKGKAYTQLSISVLTLGFASPMSWVWAVIDVCTIDQDSSGTRFRS